MNPFWVSLSTYGGVTTREALFVLWAAGIRQVELAIGVKPSPDTVEVLRHYQQQGMQYRAHHAFVWIGQRSFNLAQSFDASYFERLTDWLVTMDITAYSVHAGSFSASDEPSAAYARFLLHVEQLGQLCSARGIRLGVETMYPAQLNSSSQYLLQNTAQVEQFLQDLPQVELVVDMAHLNIWKKETIPEKLQLLGLACDSDSEALASLRASALLLSADHHISSDALKSDRLLEIHISDNDGYRDSHTAISDRTWWVPYAAMIPPNVAIVLESRMNRQSALAVRQQIEMTKSLLALRAAD